jgi:hypothetical protein
MGREFWEAVGSQRGISASPLMEYFCYPSFQKVLVILSGPGTEAFVIELSLQVFPRQFSFRQ